MWCISSHFLSAAAVRRLSLALILALLGGVVLAPIRVRGAGCTTSGPASGAYAIMLCFVTPVDGTSVTGVTTVTVSPTVTGANPGIRRLIFYLDGQYMLTDYESSYTFDLFSDRFADGSHVLAV